ncbi:hypothetical protein PBS_48160 [Paraburkholderia sp. 2C]
MRIGAKRAKTAQSGYKVLSVTVTYSLALGSAFTIALDQRPAVRAAPERGLKGLVRGLNERPD